MRDVNISKNLTEYLDFYDVYKLGKTSWGKSNFVKTLAKILNSMNEDEEAAKASHAVVSREPVNFIHVPGVEDTSELRSRNKILEEINEINPEIDTILYTIDTNDSNQVLKKRRTKY